jgi:arginine decarboxylase
MRLYEKLLKIKEEDLRSFHVPGHKHNKEIFSSIEAFDNILNMDITEFEGSDDLHHPEGAILESQKFAANLYQAETSFFLVNGSTCGIYAMMMAATVPGDTLLIQRDCHKAVFQGLFLGHIQGEYIQAKMDDDLNIPLGLTLEGVKASIDANPQAKGIVLTYPNYYGIACDLKAIVEYAHAQSMLVLVDAAHGAHLFLNESLPACALACGADLVVQSSHKTLPAMTQTSLLHLNSKAVDEEKLKRMLRLHQSSSPSYVLMGMLDAALTYVYKNGVKKMESLLRSIDQLKKEHPETFLSKEDLPKGFYLDPTKLVYKGIKTKKCPRDLEIKLRRSGIQMEFSNENVGVFVTSIMNCADDFQDLSKKMAILNIKCYSGEENKSHNIEFPIVMTLWDAYYAPSKRILFKEALNHISKEYLIPYPPGVPLLLPGEKISSSLIEYIEALNEAKITINGLHKDDINNLYIDIINLEEVNEKRNT